jgi:uncharacterized membrane protein YjdF
VFAILKAWFEGEFVFHLVYLYLFAFLLHFLHTHLSYPVSPIILACIWMIMLVIVLGCRYPEDRVPQRTSFKSKQWLLPPG